MSNSVSRCELADLSITISTYVYSQLPDDYVHYNRPLPPLFDNSTAVGLTDLNEYYLVQINSTASIQYVHIEMKDYDISTDNRMAYFFSGATFRLPISV